MLAQPHSQSQSYPQPGLVPGLHAQPFTMSQPQPTLFHDGSAPVFRACASAMQRPTLTNVRIRSTRDANQIFYAVARNTLPMTVRRLDAEERRAIISGNVYVWEERGASSEATGLGIERWTDGMRWSPSRVRDEFLFYHQKEMDPEEAADLPPTRWARIVRPKATGSDGSSSDAAPDKIPHQRALNDPEKLIKQTYSVLVSLPEDRQRGVLRKWHLTAYFTQATVDDLATVDEVLPTPHVMVPEGLFRSARAGKVRRDTSTRQQQQQRQIPFDNMPLAGPSEPAPSAMYPPSAGTPSTSPYAPQPSSYAHMPPHPHAMYSAFVQDEGARISVPMHVDPPQQHGPPLGISYSVAPPVAAPQGPVSEQSRGRGIMYTQSQPSPLDREPEQGSALRASPPRVPRGLPGTIEPARPRMSMPAQLRSPSYSHPYANALPSHFSRTPMPLVPSHGISPSRPPVSQYYVPSKPIAPIELPMNQRRQALGPPANAHVGQLRHSSYSREDLSYAGAGDVEMEMEMEMEAEMEREVGPGIDYRLSAIQREPAIGPTRMSASPSPRRKNVHLPAHLPALPTVGPSGSVLTSGSGSGSGTALGPSSVMGVGLCLVVQAAPSAKASPVGGTLALEEERERSLVPLDSLENALFPRRDPTDDALLRRFNALRTAPPASGVTIE